MSDNNTNKELSYTEEDIQSLEYCEHIRQRYGMYVGADPSTHITNEVLDNSIDEAMSGFADLIIVNLNTKENKMQIIDNGRGIPNGTHPKTGLNTLVVAVSKENSGGKFNGSKSFKASGGLNGTGLKATNALSEYFEAISERDGRRVQACFSKGKQKGTIKNLPLTGTNGTTITFIPDKKLLNKDSLYKFKPEKIKESCQMRAYLNKGTTIELIVDDKEKYTFNYNKGVEEYIENKVAKPLYGMKPITIEKEYEDNKYELSFVYDSESTDEKMMLYTNSIRNTSGTNETGFKKGLTTAVNKFINKHELIPKKQKLKNISGDDIRKGIVCCINGKVLEPLYSAQIKTEINNTEITGEISKMLTDYLEVYMEENLELFKKICTRIIQFAIATNNLKNLQKKIVSVSSAASGFAFSDKYTDCKLSDPNVIELLICEGNSAAGSLKPGRIGIMQAVYALKGKPLNTYGASGSNLISNFEINELMLIIFGTNNKKEIKYENIRFKRIIFAADSDEDGLHIICLLALLFKEHFVRMILDGRIFVACPPKYRITVNNKYVYFKNDKEFNEYKSKYVGSQYEVINENISLLELIKNEDKFKRAFNNLKNKYSLPSEIISMILSNDDLLPVAEYLDEQGLYVSETETKGEFYAQGLLEYEWLDVYLTKEMQEDIKALGEIYGSETVVINDITNNELYECDIIDAIELVDTKFKFSRYRFKGLTKKLALILLT